jgi:hypothetical protein
VNAGSHGVAARLVDKSVLPYAKTPLLAEDSVSVPAATANPTIVLNVSALMSQLSTGSISFTYQRATHLQIWMKAANSPIYQLVSERHLSAYHTVGGGWTTTAYIQLDDDALLLRETLGETDITKGQMPNGKLIHHQQGVTFVAGVSYPDASADAPRVLASNIVHFSRTDSEEPENFPPENFIILGRTGDEIRGFVAAGDDTLILGRESFSVARRLGTFLQFFEEGGPGQGMAFQGACCSMGNHAAWVSDESIWLYDGLSRSAPTDIGFPIRDWIRGLHSTAERVRIVWDSVNRLLWVCQAAEGSNLGEAMVFHFDDDPAQRAWTKRENIRADAPFTGFGIENSSSRTSTYRLASDTPTLFKVIDYDTVPIVEGGFSAFTNTLYGTIGSNLGSVTTLTGLSIPDGASAGFRGLFVHFFHAGGAESVRLITTSTGTSITWAIGRLLVTGDRWVIGAIPFRLRFPPVRGEDPFAVKSGLGCQTILDSINYGGQAGQTASLAVKLFRDLATTLATGESSTIPLTSGASVVAADRACAVEASGNILELQIEQLDRHVDFSLIYAGLVLNMPGTFGGDQNTAV